jgi:hypothetical protein
MQIVGAVKGLSVECNGGPVFCARAYVGGTINLSSIQNVRLSVGLKITKDPQHSLSLSLGSE